MPAPRPSTTSPSDNGDGPGYLLAGFGCDGKEFSVDALRVGSARRGDDLRSRGDQGHDRPCSPRPGKVRCPGEACHPDRDGGRRGGLPGRSADGPRGPSGRSPRSSARSATRSPRIGRHGADHRRAQEDDDVPLVPPEHRVRRREPVRPAHGRRSSAELGERPDETSGGESAPSGQDDNQTRAPAERTASRVASPATTKRRCRRCRRSRRRPSPPSPPTERAHGRADAPSPRRPRPIRPTDQLRTARRPPEPPGTSR